MQENVRINQCVQTVKSDNESRIQISCGFLKMIKKITATSKA